MSGWYFWPILGFVGFSALRLARGLSILVVAFKRTNNLNQERKRQRNTNILFFSVTGGQGSPDRWPGVKSLCAVCGTQGIY